MKILFGIIVIIIGTLMVIKSEAMLQAFGRVDWAEQHLGTSGGTRLFYKLCGLLIIVLSLMAMTGMLGNIILGIFGPLFGGVPQS